MRKLHEKFWDYLMENDRRWYTFVVVLFVTLGLVLGILDQVISSQVMQLRAR